MSSRVKIDLQAGTLEMEGSEDFIRDIYRDFKERLLATNAELAPRAAKAPTQQDPRVDTPRHSSATKRSAPKSSREKPLALVKDLDLATKGSRVGLKDFVKKYKVPPGALNWNAVFVYYLSRIAGIDAITNDHIYTCYKHVGQRVPGSFSQSLFDTARKKGWIDTKLTDDIKLTTAGENWVEHDLPEADAQ